MRYPCIFSAVNDREIPGVGFRWKVLVFSWYLREEKLGEIFNAIAWYFPGEYTGKLQSNREKPAQVYSSSVIPQIVASDVGKTWNSCLFSSFLKNPFLRRDVSGGSSFGG